MIGYLNLKTFDKYGWINTGDKVKKRKMVITILGRENEIVNIGGEKSILKK